MASLNRIVLIGQLASQPSIQVTVSGVEVARFTLSVNRPSSTGAVTQKDMIPIVAWRKAVDNVRSLQSGAVVLVEGRVLTRSFDDEQGARKWVTEVDAREVISVQGQGQHSETLQSHEHPADTINMLSSNHEFDFEGEPFTLGATPVAAEEEVPF